MAELWYRLTQLPDLTLNKYASLEGNGVDGVIEKHIAFLRQLNRKGIVSGLSYHLFYLYVAPEDRSKDTPGHRLQIYLMIRGKADAMDNVPALINASPLADFYKLESKMEHSPTGDDSCSINNVLAGNGIDSPIFNTCALLTKTETLLPAGNGEGEDYYMLREWEMNEDGRLYNMCKMMEALNHTALYRVDLYPVEKSVALRESLRKPMSILRKRQDDRGSNSKRDYDGKDVLDSYEDLIEKYDSSPHFIANVLVLANGKEDAVSILDAAGSESLLKGKYNIATFSSNFNPVCFLDGEFDGLENIRERMVVRKGRPGLIVCREDTAAINLNYLPTLFSLEEIAPFFRLPALYDGEIIQMAKETAPGAVPSAIISFYAESDKEHLVREYVSELYEDNIPNDFICLKCKGIIGSYAHEMRFDLNKEGDDYVCPHCRERINITANGLFLGVDDNGYAVYFPLENLAKHAFIAGVPGSGKTNTMHHLTSTLWKKHHIPFLVLEPAKQEYRALVNQKGMEGVYVFSPNADMSFPLHINPFEFPKGLILAEHIRRLCSVFEGAFPLDNPMPFLLDQAIEAVYRDLGWTPETVYTDETTLKFPTMSMLYKRLEDELKTTTYSEEIRGNLESALKVRIGSLLRREMGDVFDVPNSTIPPEKWLAIPAIIELESMGTGPANFLTLMLCALIREALKVNPHHDKDYARHVIFIEEAHNLIGPEAEETTGADANPKQAATAFVVKMLAEVRALKEGIVIADQLPTVMAQEVIKNTGLKIGLRITSADDRGLLGSTMAANSLQLEEMATFNIGRSLISYEGLMRPFTMQTHEWCGSWSTPHCDKDTLDTEWCKSNCRYYANGDCEPLRSDRSKITISASDAELVELMRDRDVYREICDRSFIIESTRFDRDYTKLNAQIESIIEHMGIVNLKEVDIKNFEARVYEMSEEMMATPGWEDNQTQQEIIKNTADYVGQLKLELKTKYLSSEKFRKAYDAIVDCIILARQIQDRKKHWIKLGITDFKNINHLVASGHELTQIQKMVYGVNEIQKGILLNAQRLFIIATPHLSNANRIRKELEQAIYIFKAKNILPKSKSF